MQQATIGARAAATITVDGLTFKDLNGNGVLDPYEDWRLPVVERVADLVGRMTLEEKAGLLLLTSHYMGGSPSVSDPEQGLLNTHDQWVTENRWAAESSSTRRFDPPVLEAAGTEHAINTYGLRYLIVRDNPSAPEMATWINAIQELAEGSRLGIPAVMVSNPRNHVTYAKLFGISEANNAMSIWPGELGLAATRDVGLVEEFGRVAARQWRAQGIAKGYMYMADIATEPRWTRVNGTFGEDPALAADLIAAVTRGFQGPELGTGSVSLTTKHFPGGGPRDRGSDPHFEHGRFQPYPTEGSLYRYHLPVFQAAIDAGTTSIMPYYATTINDRSAQQLHDGRAFEEVGFAYDKYLITEVLRGELGFRGYVNSDTGITTGMPWGVESLTRPERFAKAVDAGVNSFAGDGNPQPLIDAVHAGLIDESALDTSVSYLLDEIYRLGLFEDPYVDPDAAAEVCADPQAQALADAAHRRSIVLLDNTSGVLPLAAPEAATVRLFLEVVTGDSAETGSEAVRAEARTWLAQRAGIEVADSLDDATHALLWLRPELSLMNDTPDTVLSLELGADNGIDVDHVRTIESRVPTVLVVHLGNPWILDQVAPGAAAMVGAFGVLTEALLDVVTGVVTPSATLPFTVPRDAAAVEGNASDVPGHEESEGYAYTDAAGHRYVFGYGLNAF